MTVEHWFLEYPAAHGAKSVRRSLYTTMGGAEGLSEPGDLKVRPMPQPDGRIRVSIGSAIINARHVGGEQQAYQGAVTGQEVLNIEPTGSTPTTGRSMLVVMQVENPKAVGDQWPEPADPVNGPFIHIRVINVPAKTKRLQDVPEYKNRTAVTLARIDMKPNQATIDEQHITDLREVARPRRQSELRTYALVGKDTAKLTYTGAYPLGNTWPAAVEDAWGEIDIPIWATRMKIVMTWAGVLFYNNSWGEIWIQVGASANPDRVVTQSIAWDAQNAPGNYRAPLIAADNRVIPKGLRGTSQKFYPRARRDPAAQPTSTATLDWGSAMVLQIEFAETAD